MTYFAKGKKMWRYPANSTMERLRKKNIAKSFGETEILFYYKKYKKI